MNKTRKQRILNKIEDLVTDFVYYDRKEDSNLPVGSIEEAVDAGEITVAEMVGKFMEVLSKVQPR